jgi:SAM-dependent methyltransferase
MDISAVYDRRFFARQVPWRHEYDIVADALAARLPFNDVLDLGCGSGFLIARLARHGKAVTGVDGSPDSHIFAAAEVRHKIMIRDLRQPLDLGRYDLVICSEVAEHLPAAHADTLVASVCRNAVGWVFFTAALPGQGGHGHVNEQPHDYWIDKFRRRGYPFDLPRTMAIRQDLAGSLRLIRWFARNAMLFSAARAETAATAEPRP